MNWYLLPLKKYFDFKGRAQRKEFWIFYLGNMTIMLFFMFAIYIATENNQLTLSYALLIPYLIFWFLILIPNLAVFFRRMHDIGKSAWWILIAIIPIIGHLILLYFLCSDSQPGDNKYGPNPKI